MSDDSGRVALVTGASRGIGAAIAKRLAADGFRVAGTATTSEGARGVEDALGDAGIGTVLQLEDDASVAVAIDDVQVAWAHRRCWSTTPASPATTCSCACRRSNGATCWPPISQGCTGSRDRSCAA